jgi:hypothetical protein
MDLLKEYLANEMGISANNGIPIISSSKINVRAL